MIRRRNKSYRNKSELQCNRSSDKDLPQRDGWYIPKSRITKKNIALRYSETKKYDTYDRIFSDTILQKLREGIEGDYYILDQPIPSHSAVGPRHIDEVILYIIKPGIFLVWKKESLHLYTGSEDRGEIGERKLISMFRESKRLARKNNDLSAIKYLTRLIKLLEDYESKEE